MKALTGRDYSSALTLMELPLEDISEEEAITDFGWLLDLGYVEGNPNTTANRVSPLDYDGVRITGQGAVFLETSRDQGFYWNVQQKTKEIGCGQMPHVLLKIGERLFESFLA